MLWEKISCSLRSWLAWGWLKKERRENATKWLWARFLPSSSGSLLNLLYLVLDLHIAMIEEIIGSEGAYDWKINGTRGWFIISECHWLTIIGELRSLWFTIISSFCYPKHENFPEIFWPIVDFAGNCDTLTLIDTQKLRTQQAFQGAWISRDENQGLKASHWVKFELSHCRKGRDQSETFQTVFMWTTMDHIWRGRQKPDSTNL